MNNYNHNSWVTEWNSKVRDPWHNGKNFVTTEWVDYIIGKFPTLTTECLRYMLTPYSHASSNWSREVIAAVRIELGNREAIEEFEANFIQD